MAKVNGMVGTKNCILMSGGKKRLWLVRNCTRQEFCKLIGCILSIVTYGMKGHKIWSETHRNVGNNPCNKLHRDVCENTYIHKICCVLYCTYYYYVFHLIILSYTTSFIY